MVLRTSQWCGGEGVNGVEGKMSMVLKVLRRRCQYCCGVSTNVYYLSYSYAKIVTRYMYVPQNRVNKCY